MPLRTVARQGHRAPASDHGLPLHWLPANECECVLIERRDSY